jgi:hypothetical protein
MVSALFFVALSFFGVGGGILTAGIVTQSSSLMYGSTGFTGAGLLLMIYLCVRERWTPPTLTFESPLFNPRIYKEPGMKKNKSDTNLELMGAPKNTADDEIPA